MRTTEIVGLARGAGAANPLTHRGEVHCARLIAPTESPNGIEDGHLKAKASPYQDVPHKV